MPKVINVNQRRTEIADAAIRILARGGTSALTLRSLAEEMGGSITLITHFYANRTDLFAAILEEMSEEYDHVVEEIGAEPDPERRLRRLLEWMLPLNKRDREREAVRVALNAVRNDEGPDRFFQLMEMRARQVLAAFVAPLIPPREVAPAVDLLRALVNGLVLSSVEHPEIWTRKRQLATMELALSAIGIGQAAHPA